MSPFKVPSSYRKCSGCHDCSNVFQMSEYDDEDTYYCTKGAEKRPICGSTLMKEDFELYNNDKYNEQYERWDEWSDGRHVAPYGICDEWEEKEKYIEMGMGFSSQ